MNLNRKAMREIRNSPEVQAELLRRAERVRDAALSSFNADPSDRHEGYAADVQTGTNRARAGVVTTTAHAMNHNAKNNTLLRALEAGRG